MAQIGFFIHLTRRAEETRLGGVVGVTRVCLDRACHTHTVHTPTTPDGLRDHRWHKALGGVLPLASALPPPSPANPQNVVCIRARQRRGGPPPLQAIVLRIRLCLAPVR